MTEKLADTLRQAGEGDMDAFMAFFDATSNRVFAQELMRATALGAHGTLARQLAEEATYNRYLSAWTGASHWPDQSLSPLAWLLSMPVPESIDRGATFRRAGLACA